MTRSILLLVGLLAFSSTIFAKDFKSQLLGKKLTFTGATCAGISFDRNGKLASMYGEAGAIDCTPDLRLRVKWVSQDMFFLIEKDQTDDTSPPRTFFFKVMSIGKTALLSEVWTGWKEQPDDKQEYDITPLK